MGSDTWGSYKDLPPLLAKKTSILNIRNRDNRCFGYCIAARLLELESIDQGIDQAQQHRTRPNNYLPHFPRFGLDNIQYPVSPKDIAAIEDQLQIKINIFSFFDDQGLARYPYYISKKEYEKEVDLLYWDEHYALIKNFSAFLQENQHGSGVHAMLYCKKCFTPHFSAETLKNHNLY